MREEKLQEMDFPINIKLCIRPILNTAALQKLGYEDAPFYVQGVSNQSGNMIGWGGHRDAVTSARDVLSKVRNNVTAHQLLKWVNLYTSEKYMRVEKNFKKQVRLEKINWLDDCHMLNFSNIAEEYITNSTGISLFFNKKSALKDFAVELRLQGKNMVAHRELQDQSLFHLGDSINLDNERLLNYRVQIKKNIFVEEDPGKSCRNYPIPGFSSYTECDDEFMRKTIKEAGPGLNLTPVWLTQNLDEVTTEPVKGDDQLLSKGRRGGGGYLITILENAHECLFTFNIPFRRTCSL